MPTHEGEKDQKSRHTIAIPTLGGYKLPQLQDLLRPGGGKGKFQATACAVFCKHYGTKKCPYPMAPASGFCLEGFEAAARFKSADDVHDAVLENLEAEKPARSAGEIKNFAPATA